MTLDTEAAAIRAARATQTRALARGDLTQKIQASSNNETGRLIFSSLRDLNRLPIEDERRLKLMELYRQPVSTITRELQKNYIGLKLS